jgi:hypothetical protein
MRCHDNHFRPTLELLEKRDLLASAHLSGGYLYITSTASHDFISVSEIDGRLSVRNTPIHVGSRTVSSVSASSVSKVVVYAYGTGDIINLRPSSSAVVTKDSYIQTTGGYDQIYGGNGSNYIVAGGGHNTLVGGPRTDYLAGTATDTFNGGGGLDWYYRPIHVSYPFVSGERVSDVHQGKSPSCQAVAALAEAVRQGFNFQSSIHYLGNHVYDVALMGGRVHEHVTFNGWYTSDDPSPATPGEFWTILMYRARLQMFGVSPTTQFSTSQWNTLNNNLGGKLYSIANAITDFTGRAASFASLHTTPQTLASQMAHGDFLVAATPEGSGASRDGIIYDHAYAVMSVYYSYGMWKVRLYNPWGFDSIGGRTIESLAGGAPTNKGFITLSWSQFVSSANFTGVTHAPASAAQAAYFRSLSGARE